VGRLGAIKFLLVPHLMMMSLDLIQGINDTMQTTLTVEFMMKAVIVSNQQWT
jgi:hypothetical protein